MHDAALVVAVAAEMVRLCGEDALSHIREQAAIAAGIDDDLSLNAWTDIAEAVAMLMGREAVVMLRPRPRSRQAAQGASVDRGYAGNGQNRTRRIGGPFRAALKAGPAR
jgi:hypothetical protein